MDLTSPRRMLQMEGIMIKDLTEILPDPIWHDIISLLPIKEVLRASAVSRKWQDFSKHITSIDIDETKYNLTPCMRHSFMKSVENFLLHRKRSFLLKFKMIFCRSVRGHDIDSWLSSALCSSVQELKIHLPFGTEIQLPDLIFSSKSLKTFEFQVHSQFKIPSSVCISNLKTLHLMVEFPDKESTKTLFAGFPVLEELELYNCEWGKIVQFTICIPSLKIFTIHNDVVLLSDLLCHRVITVCAENLKFLHVQTSLTFELRLCKLYSLRHAYLDVDVDVDHPEQERILQRVGRLLDGIRRVKSLELSNGILMYLGLVESISKFLPKFENLVRLKVILNSDDYTCETLMQFLCQSPSLRSLHIPKEFHPNSGWMDEAVPECVKTSLTSISISGFTTKTTEISLLGYFHKNARMLSAVNVYGAESLETDMHNTEKIMEQLDAAINGE